LTFSTQKNIFVQTNKTIMRILFTFLFLSIAALISAQPTFSGCHHGEHRSFKSLNASEQKQLKASMERSDTIDIVHYNVTLSVIDFTGQRIYGNCAITFTPEMNNVQMLPLDLLNMQVDSVTGFGSALTFSYDSLYLAINLPVVMNIGDTATVTVWYQGRPTPDPSWGGFKFDGQYAYNLGIGLNSNPVNMGRSWFPCFDNFVERATIGINIYSKLPRRAYAIGNFMGETTVSGDTILRQYLMSQLVTTYITHVAVSNYTQVDYTHNAMNGPLPFQLVAQPGDTSSMRGTFAGLGDAVDALESWWGPYWWQRVGYILTPQGAMEHPTSIAYPRNVGVAGNTVGQQDLMSHELGHCWWGNVVTLEGPYDMWIKEGNAEYSGHLFSEYLYGHQTFIDKVKTNHKNVLRRAHFDDNGYQALSGMPFEHTYGTHTYYKGAAMLHNMRTYLGDSLFRVGQQAVLNANAYGAINAAQYRDGLSAATGINMSDFFNAWIFTPGYSSFELNKIDYQLNATNVDLTLVLEQKLRAAPQFHNNVPIEITLIDANWNKEVIKTMVSGQFDTIQVSASFVPVSWIVNEANALNLAQMHKELTVSTTGSLPVPFVEALLLPAAVPAPFQFSMDHYWTAPDPIINNPYNARISSTHYWRVDGDFNQIAGTLRFEYNAFNLPRFDNDLVGTTEDSIILVYRPGPDYDWKEHPHYTKINLFNPTDGNGFLRVDTILKGEYAFANGELPEFVAGTLTEAAVWENLNVYPNPATDYFTIEGKCSGAHNLLKIELFDLQGRLVLEETFVPEADSFRKQFILNELSAGVYWLKISDKRGVLIDAQTLGITR